eukprot:2056398-Rhodomonas_salina.1
MPQEPWWRVRWRPLAENRRCTHSLPRASRRSREVEGVSIFGVTDGVCGTPQKLSIASINGSIASTNGSGPAAGPLAQASPATSPLRPPRLRPAPARRCQCRKSRGTKRGMIGGQEVTATNNPQTQVRGWYQRVLEERAARHHGSSAQQS